jgi:hypothetical protein
MMLCADDTQIWRQPAIWALLPLQLLPQLPLLRPSTQGERHIVTDKHDRRP